MKACLCCGDGPSQDLDQLASRIDTRADDAVDWPPSPNLKTAQSPFQKAREHHEVTR
jgi:hypothetical protein